MTTPLAWRLSIDISQAEAATRVGVKGRNPARTWQRWERGEATPPIHVVVAVEVLSFGQVTAASWMKVRSQHLQSC